jgi:hypothetical protein
VSGIYTHIQFLCPVIDPVDLSFHFDTAAGGGHVQPCEAAYLASLNPEIANGAIAPEVVVLVM